jgi:hypothetical protein
LPPATAFACRYAEAEAELEAALALPAAGSFPGLGAYAALTRAFFIDHPAGRIAQTLAALDEAMAYLAEHQAEDPLAYLVVAHSWRGVVFNQLGRYEETLAEARRMREVAERRAMGPTVIRGDLWLRSVALAELGRWEELEAELRSEASAWARHPGTAFAYRYHTMAARLAAHQADAAAVRTHVEAARDELRGYRAAVDQAGVFADLALAAWEVGLSELARELIDEAMTGAHAAATPSGASRAHRSPRPRSGPRRRPPSRPRP